MNDAALKNIRDFKPVTPEGKRMQEAARRFRTRVSSKENAFRVLQEIGLFDEKGQPNPYFYPDRTTAKKS